MSNLRTSYGVIEHAHHIDSSNGLLPARHQAILPKPMMTHVLGGLSKNTIHLQVNQLQWLILDMVSAHYSDVIMRAIASQITSITIVYSTVYSGADQRKHQSSLSLAFVWGIHQWPVNSPHKWPVTLKMFPFHDVIMKMTTFLSQFQSRHWWYMYISMPNQWVNFLRIWDLSAP